MCISLHLPVRHMLYPALFALSCNMKEMDLFTFIVKSSNTEGVAAWSFLRKLPLRNGPTRTGWTQEWTRALAVLSVRMGFTAAENRLTATGISCWPEQLPQLSTAERKGLDAEPQPPPLPCSKLVAQAPAENTNTGELSANYPETFNSLFPLYF